MRRKQENQPVAGETLEVWYESRLVGRIERLSKSVLQIAFSYDPAWAKAKDAFPISTLMPLDQERHDPSITYPWFLNLLPEGGALNAVGNLLGINELDVFGMLAEMGRDLPGALDIRPSGLTDIDLRPRYRPLDDAELADAIRRLPERPLLVGEDGVHMSVAGAQDKLPVVRFKDGKLGLALDGAASTHILKPRNKNFLASVENEAFCLRLAAAVKLQVAKASVHKVEDIEYLLVERYDRRIVAGRVQRIHQEDLCQAAGYPPYLKYEWNKQVQKHGPSLKSCMDLLSKTGAPALNKVRFFEYMLFNILVGNVDAHSKNYSILIAEGGRAAMAPLYDIMNGDIYPNVTRNLAMKIATKQRGGHIYGRHWDRFAEENGLSPRLVRRRVETLSKAVLDAIPAVVEEMERSVLNSRVYSEIGGYVSAYCRSMLTNLQGDPKPGEEDEDDADIEIADEAASEPIVISP